jgi:hypothetical protein
MIQKSDLKRLERQLAQFSSTLDDLRRDLRASQPSKSRADHSSAATDRLIAYLALAPGVK